MCGEKQLLIVAPRRDLLPKDLTSLYLTQCQGHIDLGIAVFQSQLANIVIEMLRYELLCVHQIFLSLATS